MSADRRQCDTVAEPLPPGTGAAGHRLDPLLNPGSIAFVGASPRRDTPGNDMLRLIERAGYAGEVFLINPNRDEIDGRRCWPSLAALPQPVDLAVLAVANARLEQALAEAIAAGARAAALFGSCYLDGDVEPPLTQRLAARARAAGMPVCGGNGMGFYNDAARVWVGAFDAARTGTPGGVTLISHAGSVYAALAHNDPRFRFNLAVSAGQELVTTVADYLDYALDQPETRVVGLFLEAVRDPDRFVAALARAAERRIPVVVLKVGRTEASAALALSHSGAITGDDAAYRALFERHGVLQVDTLDELAATLLLFDQPRRPAAGGLAAIHDSGGEREMVIDLAAKVGVPFARIGPDTVARLTERLEYGLPAVNPLDAWGTGADFPAIFADCFAALLDDPDAAMGIFFNDMRDDYYVHAGFMAAAREAFARTAKPVAYATNFTQVRHERASLALTEAGIPVLDGTVPALTAARLMLAHRDFLARPADPPPTVRPDRDWRARLSHGAVLDEAESLALLADYGIATTAPTVAETADEAVAAARALGYPVALKTAVAHLHHKSDRGGVKLGLGDDAAVRAAYADLAGRLGKRVVVARMAAPGVELALGLKVDAQFGPVVMAAAGGIWIEVLDDAGHALAPFGPATARRLIDGLRVARLLDGVRGAAPVDRDRLAQTIARFSVLAADLAGWLSEIDVNPIIAGPDGAVAVDALVVPAQPGRKQE